MLHKSQRIRQITDEVLGRAGIQRPKISLTLRNFETAQLLAAQGMGVTFVPLEYSRITSEEYHPALLSIDNAYQAHWDMCITSLKRRLSLKSRPALYPDREGRTGMRFCKRVDWHIFKISSVVMN